MELSFILIGVAAVLFVLAYATKRRFGVLGLGLAAGYVVSQLWQNDIPSAIQAIGVDLGTVPLETVVTLVVLLLPSLVLLFGGPVYKTKRGRFIGALLYVVVAVLFSLGTLEYALPLDATGMMIYGALFDHQQYILTAALALAVVDNLYARSGGGGEKHDKKH